MANIQSEDRRHEADKIDANDFKITENSGIWQLCVTQRRTSRVLMRLIIWGICVLTVSLILDVYLDTDPLWGERNHGLRLGIFSLVGALAMCSALGMGAWAFFSRNKSLSVDTVSGRVTFGTALICERESVAFVVVLTALSPHANEPLSLGLQLDDGSTVFLGSPFFSFRELETANSIASALAKRLGVEVVRQ